MSQPIQNGVSAAGVFGRRPWAIVEIDGDSDEKARTELIQAAYHLSRSGLVALALRGVSRQTVDRALDAVVDVRNDPDMEVVYLDADDRNADLLAAASRASVVVACSEAFRDELRGLGIDPVTAEDGALGVLALSDTAAEVAVLEVPAGSRLTRV
jgi:hypothetical protein